MSEGHVTHYDDCGCQSAALKERIATLEAEIAAAKELADSYRLAMDDSDHRGMGWMAHAAMLRDALREFTPGGVPHNGVACALREFAAERQRASGKWDGRSETLVQWAIAIEAALASTPAASLAAYRKSVLEACVLEMERRGWLRADAMHELTEEGFVSAFAGLEAANG